MRKGSWQRPKKRNRQTHKKVRVFSRAFDPKYPAWEPDPEGQGGTEIDFNGNFGRLAKKPELGPAPKDFKRTPKTAAQARAEGGSFVQTPAGEIAPILSEPGGQLRTEFLGEVMDRRNAVEKAAVARLGARLGAKQKLDKQGLELGYMPSQLKELDALRNARADAEKKWRNDEYSDDDLKRFEEQIWLKQQAVIPQMIRKQPTVQEKFQSRMWTDPNTNLTYHFDDKDQPKLLDGMPTNKDLFDLAKEIRKAGIELKDKEGELTGEFRDFTEEEVSQRVAEAIRGASEVRSILGGGASSERQPQARFGEAPRLRTKEDFARQTDTTGRLQAIRQKAIEEGMTEAEADEIVNRLQKGQPAQPAPTGHKLFAELPQAKQKELLENFRKAERGRGRRATAPRTIRTPMGQITKPRGTPFKRETDASFINEYNTNEVFRRKTKIFERKAGALPTTWEELTDREQGKMVAIWNTDFLGFAEKELSESEMKAKVKADPELIGVLLRK